MGRIFSLEIFDNFILPPTCAFVLWSDLPVMFPTTTLYTVLIFSACYVTSHLVVLDLISVVILGRRGLCVGLITRPEKTYWVSCVCDLEASIMRRPWSSTGCCAIGKESNTWSRSLIMKLAITRLPLRLPVSYSVIILREQHRLSFRSALQVCLWPDHIACGLCNKRGDREWRTILLW
jgi:hypothetical protein